MSLLSHHRHTIITLTTPQTMSLSATRIGKILLRKEIAFSCLEALHNGRKKEHSYQKVVSYNPEVYARILAREVSDTMFHTFFWSTLATVGCAWGWCETSEFVAIPLGGFSIYSAFSSLRVKDEIDGAIAEYDLREQQDLKDK